MVLHLSAILIVFAALACGASATDISRTSLPQTRKLLQSCSTSNFCQGKPSGTYADPCSTTSFIQCSNDRTFVTACPSGLVWDTSCTCCNWPKTGPTPPATPSPPAPTPSPPAKTPSPPSVPAPTPTPPASPKSPSPTPASPSPPAPSSTGKVKAAYWGQGASSSTLASVCGKYDIVFISFLNNFGSGQDVTSSSNINIAGHSLTQTAQDITTCQKQGRQIIISMGGAIGNYGFTSAQDAQSAAKGVWNAYLGGSGTNRPFGAGVVLDGVDLDVEKNNGEQYYSAFVTALKALYKIGTKKYLLTAVPQCPFPDGSLGPGAGSPLGDAGQLFDYVSIQFYNNPSCGGSNTVSGYGPWNTWAQSSGVKLLPTFPAAASDAGSGYQAANAVAAELQQLRSDSTYGGWNLFTAEDDAGFSSQLPS